MRVSRAAPQAGPRAPKAPSSTVDGGAPKQQVKERGNGRRRVRRAVIDESSDVWVREEQHSMRRAAAAGSLRSIAHRSRNVIRDRGAVMEWLKATANDTARALLLGWKATASERTLHAR